MPGEPVCRRESRAGEPVVDSGYMEPASLVLTCSLLHGGKILEKKQSRGEVIQKTSWVCPGGSVLVRARMLGTWTPHIRRTDRPTRGGSDKGDGRVQWFFLLPPQLPS